MASLIDDESRPLLSGSSTPTSSTKTLLPSDELQTPSIPTACSLDNDIYPSTSPLTRTISRRSAYILIISRVIGSGIFATPGSILKSVHSIGLSLTLWLIGAIISACGLAVTLEYGCMLPLSGGEKVYLEFTYRRPRFLASTMVATMAVCLGFTASNCVVFARYAVFAVGVEGSDAVRKILAVGLLTVVTVLHGCFLRAGIRVQDFLGYVKIGLVVLMILTGLFIVLVKPATSGLQPTRLPSWNSLWQDSNWNWSVVSSAIFKVFYSYAGLGNVNNVMNEVRDPVRTLKFVSVAALATACALYLLVNVAYFMVVPVEEIRESGELVAALFFERAFGGRVGGVVLPVAVALSAAGNVMVVTFALARLNQEIARQGFLPFSKYLSSSKPFNAPLGGLIVHYIPSVLVITLPPSKETYSFILDVEGYPAQVVALAVSVGVLWLRFKRPDLKRPFKAWIGAVLLRIALALALLAAPFFPPEGERTRNGIWYASYAVVGMSVLVFGFIYWFVWTRLIPRWRGYRLEEKSKVLDDGTTVMTLVHVPI